MWRAVLGRASRLCEWVRWASSASEQRLRRLEACRALGVAPGAPPEAVRRAYYQLAKRCHPDLAGAAATPRFLQLQTAYQTLRDHHHQLQQAAAAVRQAEPGWHGVTMEHGLRRRVLVRRQGNGACAEGVGACADGYNNPLWTLLTTIARFLRRPHP